MTPIISIVTIVKDDPGIEKTLSGLELIKKPAPTEILVIDGSEGAFKELEKKFPKVKWIPYHNTSKRKITIPHQRNLGLQSAKGEVIVFIDASCTPEKNWLTALYDQYLKKNEKIVAGQVKTSDTKVLNNISARASTKSKYLEECPTANVLIAKEVINSVGEFDETFEYGSDVDFMWRCREKNYKIAYEPLAVITHDWGTKAQQVNRSYRYGKARMKLYLKHLNYLTQLPVKDPILAFYPLFFLFLPLALIWPAYLLIGFIPVIKNYKYKPLETTAFNAVYGIGALIFLLKFPIHLLTKNLHA